MPLDVDFYLPLPAERKPPSTVFLHIFQSKNPHGLRETPQFIQQDPARNPANVRERSGTCDALCKENVGFKISGPIKTAGGGLPAFVCERK